MSTKAASIAQEYQDAGKEHPFYNLDGTTKGAGVSSEANATAVQQAPSTAPPKQGANGTTTSALAGVPNNDGGSGINNAPSTTSSAWLQDDAPVPYTPPASGSSYNKVASDGRTITLNQPTDTVAGQLDSILAEDSALMKRARNQADIRTNKAGLLGSSAMQRASMGAMIDKGFDIASQDAAGYLGARTKSAELSSAEMMNADNLNAEAGWREADRFQDQSQFESDQTWQAKQNNQQQAWDSAENDEDRVQAAKEWRVERDLNAVKQKHLEQIDYAELDLKERTAATTLMVSAGNTAIQAAVALANSPQASAGEAASTTAAVNALYETIGNAFNYDFVL